MKDLPIRTVSKALAGIVVAVVTKYFVDHDIIIDGAEFGTAVEYIITAGIGFLMVYLAPRNEG